LRFPYFKSPVTAKIQNLIHFRGASLCAREAIQPNQVILHSDNGGPMKGATMLATLQALGVMPSLSRPGVSNDNPLYVAADGMLREAIGCRK
jgi:hypothetical protein